MNGQEKISVIIPVYNAEKYLKFCIESVLDPEIELILIDDGSTDQSAKIIEEYNNLKWVFGNQIFKFCRTA